MASLKKNGFKQASRHSKAKVSPSIPRLALKLPKITQKLGGGSDDTAQNAQAHAGQNDEQREYG
jgi:hypothetical protein